MINFASTFGWLADRFQSGARGFLWLSRLFADVELWLSGLGDWSEIRSSHPRPFLHGKSDSKTTQARWPS